MKNKRSKRLRRKNWKQEILLRGLMMYPSEEALSKEEEKNLSSAVIEKRRKNVSAEHKKNRNDALLKAIKSMEEEGLLKKSSMLYVKKGTGRRWAVKVEGKSIGTLSPIPRSVKKTDYDKALSSTKERKWYKLIEEGRRERNKLVERLKREREEIKALLRFAGEEPPLSRVNPS